MLRWLMGRWIRGFEREWDYDAELRARNAGRSPRAAWLFSRAAQLGRYRK